MADRVIVTSKHNDDDQYIWESDASSFTLNKDPRGNTLGRGTTISLYLKEEASDFLEKSSIKDLVLKYSQFINFNIYLWDSTTIQEEEPIEEDDEIPTEPMVDEQDDEDAAVEEEDEDDVVPKSKKVDKTVWDWTLINNNKPLWTRKPNEIEDEEYNDFYKNFSKDSDAPMAKTHFTAEGEVTFKSILFIPAKSPSDTFQSYGTLFVCICTCIYTFPILKWIAHIYCSFLSFSGKKVDFIKMYVRRVFITDNFEDMMPKYLSFVKGIVDSDDLPLNVSRETLQQHKLLKVIKKKLVRKSLDMIKKISDEDYEKFWKEYSTK